MYGSQSAGFFGYSHFTGGFAGGQAEYVRVPIADANLLEIPDGVPDEKGKLCHCLLCIPRVVLANRAQRFTFPMSFLLPTTLSRTLRSTPGTK